MGGLKGDFFCVYMLGRFKDIDNRKGKYKTEIFDYSVKKKPYSSLYFIKQFILCWLNSCDYIQCK